MTAGEALAAAPDLRAVPREAWGATLRERYASGLPGVLDIAVDALEPGRIEARVELRDELMQRAGGILHAGTVIAFADSCAGWGCMASLPDGATGFVTSELKANLVASAVQPDTLIGCGRLLHGGRTTQVWDVTVARASDGRTLAHFRCTQHLLND